MGQKSTKWHPCPGVTRGPNSGPNRCSSTTKVHREQRVRLGRLWFQFQLQLKSRAGCEHGNHRWRSYRGRCACHDFRMHVYSMPPQESINAAEQTPCCQLGSPRSLLRPIDGCLDSPVPDNSMFAKKKSSTFSYPIVCTTMLPPSFDDATTVPVSSQDKKQRVK